MNSKFTNSLPLHQIYINFRAMPAAKKVLTLDIDYGFLDDVYIIGIQAPLLPLHRLAYFLNENAQWDLCRFDDYLDAYAMLQCKLPLERLNVFLLENKNPDPLVKCENCDYFLIACGQVKHYDFKALTEMVENIESVFSVYKVEVDAKTDRHDPLTEFLMMKGRFPGE